MGSERLELGTAPRVIVACNGSLDVRGGGRAETRIDADDPLTVEQVEGGVHIHSAGDCTIRLPEGGSVEIREVLGDCRVKDVGGAVSGQSVHGSCTIRRVASLSLDEVLGDARIREVAGPVQLRAVHGSLTVRDVDGPLNVEEVFGDFLGRGLGGSVELDEVAGMLALRTGFAPESVSRVSARGDAMFRVPADASVLFVLPDDVELSLDHGLEPTREGDRRMVTVGGGAATVRVEDAAAVRIKQSGAYEEEASFGYGFAAIGSDWSEHLSDISAELEAQFATLETDLASTISERVRRQVERRLHSARRQVDAAQRRVEKEVERAERFARGEGGPFGVSVDIGGEQEGDRQHVSEQERMMILQMLEEGKISVEEAEKLLTALEGK